MTYSQIPPDPETPRRIAFAIMALAGLALSGCAAYSPEALLHRYEGGVINSGPPPAPGLESPWPNLAAVPARPVSLSPAAQTSIRTRLEAANRGQNSLGGHPPASPKPAPPAPAVPPLRLGFAPRGAVLSSTQLALLRGFAARRGGHPVIAAGFAPADEPESLRLALLRATAVANALEAAGVPPSDIRIEALAGGRGGVAQVIYPRDLSTTPDAQDRS
ncbi:MAG: hypothetical protein B7Z59_07050 [Acidiphilium sp. 37-67-22]|nr:MAG: hypothetical protein B7Z59_07050 [Acidiphilium sp. 37-67-22]HQT73777.1 hypothetical protein [Acidiphilium sp.]